MTPIDRRRLLHALGAACALAAGPAVAQGGPASSPAGLRSVVVLDLELVDDQHNPATVGAQQRRLREAHVQLQRALEQRGLYRVLEPAPTAALQASLRSQQAFLYRCADCAEQVGRLAGAELAMTGWVQKVSELILNFNVEVHDVARQEVVLAKSVDMRGNEDLSWRRAVDYLVRDMAEKRARNPRYGL